MKGTVKPWAGASRRSGERGQTIIFVVLGLSIVFLAVLGFAVDFGNLWFHRQTAQTAADAACTAAAMNMLDNVQGGNSGLGFAWDDFDCSGGNSNFAPCQYFYSNGYRGNVSSSASFRFLSPKPDDTSLLGIPICTSPPDPNRTICIPPASILSPGSKPIIQVALSDRIKAPFFSLVASRSTIDVPAKSSCGVVLATSPLPIVVLDPRSEDTSLTGSGSLNIAFFGGPNRSVQVNNRGNRAVNFNSASGTIDLTQGGPNLTGSDVGVTGSTPQPPRLNFSATGQYISPTVPTSDPFALVNAPDKPGVTQPLDGLPVTSGQFGCPAANCRHFLPGDYPSGIRINNKVAIFDPGIYYLEGDFVSDSCMRPSNVTGGDGGTAFYFSNTSTLAVNITSTGAPCTTAFDAGLNFANIQCTPTSKIPTNLPAQIIGTVLLAPCTGPLGDQLGSKDPDGIQRGILFFQNRSTTTPVMASWQGGSDQFLLSGTIYFHQCTRGGPDTGVGCDTVNAFNDQFTFGGGSGPNSTFVLGNIVADQLSLSGAQMTIDLNPSASYWILKASLLQ